MPKPSLKTAAGVCRFCGCSAFDACEVDDGFGCYSDPCAWVDRKRDLCTACAPAAKAEAIALKTLARAGYRSDHSTLKASLDFVAAFHRGFVVGWFDISRRSPLGRNPFLHADGRVRGREFHQLEAWDLGWRAGADSSRAYVRVCGPIANAPRREILRSGRR
jgi:hypothetical protein